MVELPEKLQFLFQPSRYKVAYGGRGASKSWGFARALLIQGAAKPLRILCARETQTSIKDSVHQLLKDQISTLNLTSFYDVEERTIRGKNGTEFVFAGLRQQTITSIKSFEGADVCWVEEAQVVSKKSWATLIPTIRKEGSEIWVSLNPELDTDDTYVRFIALPPPDAAVVAINWRDNKWFTQVMRKEKDHLLATDPDEYDNVWEGKPRAVVSGAIYRHEILSMHDGRRLRPVPYDPMLKVHTVWDLGWNDQTSIILVQRVQSELRIVEYIEDSHRTLAEYVSDLNQRRYNWGTDWLPHDGASATIQTGLSAQEILRKLGRDPKVIPRLDVEQGIKAARLAFPRCYFDCDKAIRLVDCLKRYKRSIPVTTGEPGSPVHDEYSHGADAFRYLAMIADKLGNDDMKMKPIQYSNKGII